MEVKVKIVVKKPNIFFAKLWPLLRKFKQLTKKTIHKFFYRWNMFFMGTNKATSDVIAWDITTMAAAIFIVIITAVNFFI